MIFAPVPRDYSFKMNQKEKRAALFSALTAKVQDNDLIVLDKLSFDAVKTKNMVKVLAALKADKALVVTKGNDRNVVLSGRNLPDIMMIPSNTINVYDVMKYKKLILTKDAVESIEEVYA